MIHQYLGDPKIKSFLSSSLHLELQEILNRLAQPAVDANGSCFGLVGSVMIVQRGSFGKHHMQSFLPYPAVSGDAVYRIIFLPESLCFSAIL